MDKLDKYCEIITKILSEYAELRYAYGKIERQLFIDRNSGHYLLMVHGWENKKRVHGCLVHIDIIDGKIWIQRDGIEHGIANELVAAGIPKDRIVLGFHPPEIRPDTEYAIG